MAGKSTRFPNIRPKWMLNMPISGDLMCVESIKGLNLNFFDKIYFTFLREHEVRYNISNGLLRCLKKNNLETKSKLVILDNPTSSQSETVYNTIIIEKINGFIYVKDSDGYFELQLTSEENQIAYHDLNKTGEITACNKSYIKMENNKIVINIIEKQVISSNYCVGGYGFRDSNKFLEIYENTVKLSNECYISNIIFEMILQGDIFLGKETREFRDWGTLEDWKKYCSNFSTLFIDLDGTLITNTSEYIYPYTGTGNPIEENIEFIRDKYKTGNCKIVITTSRQESFRIETIDELKKHDIPFDHLIMGLPHSKRYIINDFSETNSYPTAIAINVERNRNNLKNLI